jgi:hypothetical protein
LGALKLTALSGMDECGKAARKQKRSAMLMLSFGAGLSDGFFVKCDEKVFVVQSDRYRDHEERSAQH